MAEEWKSERGLGRVITRPNPSLPRFSLLLHYRASFYQQKAWHRLQTDSQQKSFSSRRWSCFCSCRGCCTNLHFYHLRTALFLTSRGILVLPIFQPFTKLGPKNDHCSRRKSVRKLKSGNFLRWILVRKATKLKDWPSLVSRPSTVKRWGGPTLQEHGKIWRELVQW